MNIPEHEFIQKNLERQEQMPKKRRAFLLPLFIGILIGVVLVTFALPKMVDHGLIKPQTEQRELENKEFTQVVAEDGKQAQSYQNVSVDVSTQVTEIVDAVADTVVGIRSFQADDGSFWGDYEDLESIGSGVIYKIEDENAYLVTNHHVIEGAEEIEIVLSDDTRLDGEIIGSDLYSDLAVIRMESEDVHQAIDIGSSESSKVGEPVLAIGNPLDLMFAGTITQGIISGKDRTIPQDFNTDGQVDWQVEVIQTDAAINPGNSGGALINLSGQLIGINSMKINQSAVEGLGFAIPIDTALPIMDKLEKEGEVIRPYLGVDAYSIDDLPYAEWENSLHLPEEVTSGVYLRSVDSFSPADEAGLERFDVIVELDGKEIDSTMDIRKILFEQKEVDDTVKVTYYRGKERETVEVQLRAKAD